MKKLSVFLAAILLAACASQKPVPSTTIGPSVRLDVPSNASQGELVLGRVPPGSKVKLVDESSITELKVAENGRIVFGIGRDETQTKTLHVTLGNGEIIHKKISVEPRKFEIENINGVPQETVTPNPANAARIEAEQAEVTSARLRNDLRLDFDTSFSWPVTGRVSGVYGSQRIYNGTPKSWHSGLDVAAAQGTPIKAPAGGIITFAKPDLYLTGGTVLIDHGMGISSNFLHLSRLDVKVGDRVEQGQIIGLVGMTGRATGPHMHWGMNWLKVRIDPQLLVPAQP